MESALTMPAVQFTTPRVHARTMESALTMPLDVSTGTKNRPVKEIKQSLKGKNLRAKQANSQVVPRVEEPYYEVPAPSIADLSFQQDDNLYDELDRVKVRQQEVDLEQGEKECYRGHAMALVEKIRRQDEELREKNNQLRRLEESCNAELRRKDEQLKKLDASRKRWHAMACRPGAVVNMRNGVGGIYYNHGYTGDLSETQTPANVNNETSTADRENQKYFDGYEYRPVVRSVKYASKKTVHLGVFLEYRKVNRINAIIIHIVICCDELLMKSTNNTKLYASKPFLVYEDREDPLVQVKSLQWAKNANEEQEEMKVVSLDMLWMGLPFEIKFIREFRSKLIAGDVPDILKFDVCVVQPRVPETTLNVWCDMKEIITTSIESKQKRLENIPALIHQNINPRDGHVVCIAEQPVKRTTLFGVPSLDVPQGGEVNNILTTVEFRKKLPINIPEAGVEEEYHFITTPGSGHQCAAPASAPCSLPRRRPQPVCDSTILGKKESAYDNIYRLPTKRP